VRELRFVPASDLYSSIAALSTLGLDTPELNGTGTMGRWICALHLARTVRYCDRNTILGDFETAKFGRFTPERSVRSGLRWQRRMRFQLPSGVRMHWCRATYCF